MNQATLLLTLLVAGCARSPVPLEENRQDSGMDATVTTPQSDQAVPRCQNSCRLG